MDDDSKTVQIQKLEALGRFAGGIAHDFNNILSIIEGHTSIALKQLKDGTLAPEQLAKIVATTQRGAGLTRQLLAFARQKLALDEAANLTETLREMPVLLEPLLGGAVRLEIALPARDVWVKASSDQIVQVVLNLALNARDAMPGGGIFAVSCAAEAGMARISFTDTGCGIAEDALPKIFDPFFTTKGMGQGTGLGLSVVYGIVDQLGGGISVRSRPGCGAAFDVSLPLAAAAAESAAGKRPVALDGKTILVAEDEAELRDVLAVLLGGMNLTVLTASNGNHALRVQEEHGGPIDFLLTDIVMPEMDGVSLGAAFSERQPGADVVYMSGYPFLDGGKSFGLPFGASFISKPFQEDKIRRILERALERRDARTGEDGPKQ